MRRSRTGWSVAAMLALGSVSLAAQARPPVIDMHMHARRGSRTGADGNPMGPACAPQPCASSKPPMYVGEGSVLRGTLEMMEKYNIVKGFIGDADEDVDVWVRHARALVARHRTRTIDTRAPRCPRFPVEDVLIPHHWDYRAAQDAAAPGRLPPKGG